MALPISYNIRNLIERKTTTLLTALGIALPVAILLAVLALVAGLQEAFQASGSPQYVLVLRKGTNAELNSSVSRQQYQDIKFKRGIAPLKNGEPAASLELVQVVNLPSVDAPDGMNVTVRGLTPAGFEMRHNVQLSAGRMFTPGQREVVVGKAIAKRYPGLRLSGRVTFARGEWEVVGVLDGGQSALNSEIFGDLHQIASDYNRPDALSSVLIRAENPMAAQALINDITSDVKLNLGAMTEVVYYEQQTTASLPIKMLGMLVCTLMAVGSAFAAMNTMYAAVARRAREIGTLRVLGFSRGSILLSFLLESLLLALLGGGLGCLLVLPLNNVTTGIGSFVTFSEIAFTYRVTPQVMLAGLLFALVLGALGGVLPAFGAARKAILVALREG
ncbi:MAG TPA: ABC transporter permease [Candidatus Saccharimonadia bacterium]|nr:ABC transporter permease [Candidatus Saccharimonadia bacterium]